MTDSLKTYCIKPYCLAERYTSSNQPITSLCDKDIEDQLVKVGIIEDRIAYYKERAKRTLFPARYTPIIKENEDKLKDAKKRLKEFQKTRAEQAARVAEIIADGVRYRESKYPEMSNKLADHTMRMGKVESDLAGIKTAFDSLSALHTDAVFRLSSLKADMP